MGRVEHKGLPFLQHISHVHAAHAGRGVHLHHLRVAARLLVHGEHRRGLPVLELCQLDLEILSAERVADSLRDLLLVLLQVLAGLLADPSLQGVLHAGVDAGKMNALVLHLQLLDERHIDRAVHDERLHLLGTEHRDILSLLAGIRHVVDRAVNLLILVGVLRIVLLFFGG